MDTSDLFSHPETQQAVSSGESSKEPAVYPTFSDRSETTAADVMPPSP
jgi:hypothetical protein